MVFVDVETTRDGRSVIDLGAFREDKGSFHSASEEKLYDFCKGADYVAGHNIVGYDLKYLKGLQGKEAIDTLLLSPLLFPEKPWHKLGKEEKLSQEERNNPFSDCRKAQELLDEEAGAFLGLPPGFKQILYSLLNDQPGFSGFFRWLGYEDSGEDTVDLVLKVFQGKICQHANIPQMIATHPVELSYALSAVNANDSKPVLPLYLRSAFPCTQDLLSQLRDTPCKEGCPYCRNQLDAREGLKLWFGYDEFRTFNGEGLQEEAVKAALQGESLLAVFPTGGGKSLAFQLPALMEGRAVNGLTVVISPLQALMKDQVDGLSMKGVTEAVMVNGLIDPVERAQAYNRIEEGLATILYIAPESLRSPTVERALLNRRVTRFVIDEAHCLSCWGQDFRVDYLYIAKFIQIYQEKKQCGPVPVSCFTATAKQKVISDITDYFEEKLGLKLKLFSSRADRVNLSYRILPAKSEGEKYSALRGLLTDYQCPVIVYSSRVRTVKELADRLTADGFTARAFYGKQDTKDKLAVQEAFVRGSLRIIIATSAFGMGVDKKDIGLIVHYEMSSSLEDYIQETGRAARDPSLEADCYVLYSPDDLDKHFRLLKDSMLSFGEIKQVWRAVKQLTPKRDSVQVSALELSRQSGWDDSSYELETRVRTAVSVLEETGYLERGMNRSRVFATSIQARDMAEASQRIDKSRDLDGDVEKTNAKRIMASLFSSRSRSRAGNAEAESRVDYLADRLGLERKEAAHIVNALRAEGLLSDASDMTAYLTTERKTRNSLRSYQRLSGKLLDALGAEEINLKRLDDEPGSVKKLQTLLYFHVIKNELDKEGRLGTSIVRVRPRLDLDMLKEKQARRELIASSLAGKLYQKADPALPGKESVHVEFSLKGLYEELSKEWPEERPLELSEVEDALLYLSKTGSLKIEGGFLVFYNAMALKRLNLDPRSQFKKEDYSELRTHYKGKAQQIHIAGEFAERMMKDSSEALVYAGNYFHMDQQRFFRKYFPGRQEEISRCITKDSYDRLFGKLSVMQKRIIDDTESRRIVVAAGPGSGKTRVLVHKLAALRLLDEVKAEQLLMLTFSRAAATEFKSRLYELIGEAAVFVEIRTFHSYSFDILGNEGNPEEVKEVIGQAVSLIESGDVEPGKVSKAVVVVDEAQDMSEDEYRLLKAIIQFNDDIRLIAVGDDDQSIYGWRGSDSKYMRMLYEEEGAKVYEMAGNYRSKEAIVSFANSFAQRIPGRLKHGKLTAMRNGQGEVTITRHASPEMAEAVVREVLETPSGRSCSVLARTNEEVLQLQCLLAREGVRTRLIHNIKDKDFSLYNLAEVRYFLRQLRKDRTAPQVTEEEWKKARGKLRSRYNASSILPLCEGILDAFRSANPDVIYFSDLEEFIRESKEEDFIKAESGTVFLSTIHKAKGREFDAVHILLKDNGRELTAEELRVIYVGFTRAKDSLYVHYNGTLLDQFKDEGMLTFKEDSAVYSEPSELLMQLGYQDVYLDFFKGKKNLILSRLMSGMELRARGYSLLTPPGMRDEEVVRYSNKFKDRLRRCFRKGYRITAASVTYIAAWKGKDDEEETAVILPCLKLERVFPGQK